MKLSKLRLATIFLLLATIAFILLSGQHRKGFDVDAAFEAVSATSATGFANWQIDHNARSLVWRWGEAAVQASLSLYLASGDTRFLELPVDTCAKLSTQRDVDLGLSNLPTWGSLVRASQSDLEPTLRASEITISGIVLSSCLRSLKLAEDQIELLETYTDIGLEIFAHHQTKDCHQDGEFALCYLPSGIEPLNHLALYGDALIELYALTKDKAVRDTLSGIAAFFKACMREAEDGGYIWDYRPTLEDCRNPAYRPQGEPFWKARSTIRFPVRSFEAGLPDFDEDFIVKITPAFHRVVRENTLCRSIGFECQPVKDDPYQYGTAAVFAILTPYDMTIGTSLTNLIRRRSDIFPQGWNSTPWSAGAHAIINP